jgi:DNA-directed RNA polymerase specialized sigma24 family protein
MGDIQKPGFWDREIDEQGRRLRVDVREAAQALWPRARSMVRAILGDASDAAEIMEACIARVSRSLEERGHALFSQRTEALLFKSLRNHIYSCAARQKRIAPILEYDEFGEDRGWEEKLELHLNMERLVRSLSKPSRIILALRSAGYSWKQIAAFMGWTVPKVKNTFWRELETLRSSWTKGYPPIGDASSNTSCGRRSAGGRS